MFTFHPNFDGELLKYLVYTKFFCGPIVNSTEIQLSNELLFPVMKMRGMQWPSLRDRHQAVSKTLKKLPWKGVNTNIPVFI